MVLARLAIVLLYLPTMWAASWSLAEERLYVAERNRVHTYSLNGQLLNTISIPHTVREIAVNDTGDIFVQSLRVSESGTEGFQRVDVFLADGTPRGTLFEQMFTDREMVDMVLHKDGLLYIGQNSPSPGDTVDRYTQDGTFVDTFAQLPDGIGAPFAMDFDSSGQLHVTHDKTIEYFSVSGQSLGAFATVAPSFFSSLDVAVDTDDNVYVLNLSFLSGIVAYERFDPVGNSLGIVHPDPVGGQSLHHLEVDAMNNVYLGFSSINGGAVKKYLPDGTPLGTVVDGIEGEIVDLMIRNIVPEPSTYVLLGVALLTLGVCRLRSWWSFEEGMAPMDGKLR